MKKLFLLLALVASACEEVDAIMPASASSETQKSFRTSYSTGSKQCADIQKYKIFQVMNNGALAFGCDINYGIESCTGLVAFVPKVKGQMYYDDMMLEPSENQCIRYDGVYSYPTKSGMSKTVPKLKFVSRIATSPQLSSPPCAEIRLTKKTDPEINPG